MDKDDVFAYAAIYPSAPGCALAVVVDAKDIPREHVAEAVHEWIMDGAVVKHMPLSEAQALLSKGFEMVQKHD